MKREYYIRRATIISCVLLIIGIILVVANAIELWRFTHPFEQAAVTEPELKPGAYIRCEVDEYLVQKLDTGGDDTYTGVGEVYVTPLSEYDVYNIPLKDKRYIRTMISDKDTIKKLEQFVQGKGSAVCFTGKLVKTEKPDRDWYGRIASFDVDDDLVQDFAVKQINISGLVNVLLLGIFIILFSTVGIYRTTIKFVTPQQEKE